MQHAWQLAMAVACNTTRQRNSHSLHHHYVEQIKKQNAGSVFLSIVGVDEAMLLPDAGALAAMYAGCAALFAFVIFWRYGRRRR
jgi:hypothetical protein